MAGERFPVRRMEENESYLGPGYYNMPREFDQSRIPIQANSNSSKEKRFKAASNVVPGPGFYKEEISLWNKKSFNLLFNNEKKI